MPITTQQPAASGQVVTSAAQPVSDPRVDTIRMHLQRYREFSAQGKWAEAGKELEAVESTVRK